MSLTVVEIVVHSVRTESKRSACEHKDGNYTLHCGFSVFQEQGTGRSNKEIFDMVRDKGVVGSILRSAKRIDVKGA